MLSTDDNSTPGADAQNFEVSQNEAAEPKVCKQNEDIKEEGECPAKNNKEHKKEKFFRKPDITSVVLCSILIVFAVCYIIQFLIFNNGKIDVKNIINTSAVSEGTGEADVTDKLLVNINTADIDVLCLLNGIGEKKAQAIIEYRNKNGNFSSIEEINQVSGIGEATFEKIKDYICI